MLTRLRIDHFAIIDQLELEFSGGLVVLTGETGAGKSIILDAIMALLGGPFDATSVRAGESKARISADFDLSDAPAELTALLEKEELAEEIGHLNIERELRLEGRTSARVNGHAVSLAVLRAIGDLLVDIHGQSEHLSLLNNRQHIGLLDRYAGAEDALRQYQHAYHRLQEIRRELRDLRAMEQEAAGRLELLRFQEQEIDSARVQEGEDAALEIERARLANAENLALAAREAIGLLDESNADMPSVTDLLGQMEHQLQQLARYDPSRAEMAAAGSSLLDQAEELVRDLRRYADGIEFNPRRLEQAEERIGLLNNLKRKYGGTLAAVNEYLLETREKLEQIDHSGERIAELAQSEADSLAETRGLARVLSGIRHEAAGRLAGAIEAELAELKMEGARFSVAFADDNTDGQASSTGLDHNGMDRVEFMIAPNPGEGLKPLVKIASGGETSRLMLALKNVLAREDRIPSLVFDEIDQGIGGRVGSIVGKKLWQLARHHQVFCVTHLPQLAAFGDQHYHVAKEIADGRTRTRVTRLDRQARINELAGMLGAGGDNALRSAEDLINQAGQGDT